MNEDLLNRKVTTSTQYTCSSLINYGTMIDCRITISPQSQTFSEAKTTSRLEGSVLTQTITKIIEILWKTTDHFVKRVLTNASYVDFLMKTTVLGSSLAMGDFKL